MERRHSREIPRHPHHPIRQLDQPGRPLSSFRKRRIPSRLQGRDLGRSKQSPRPKKKKQGEGEQVYNCFKKRLRLYFYLDEGGGNVRGIKSDLFQPEKISRGRASQKKKLADKIIICLSNHIYLEPEEFFFLFDNCTRTRLDHNLVQKNMYIHIYIYIYF